MVDEASNEGPGQDAVEAVGPRLQVLEGIAYVQAADPNSDMLLESLVLNENALSAAQCSPGNDGMKTRR
jgi:hypothetical protein